MLIQAEPSHKIHPFLEGIENVSVTTFIQTLLHNLCGMWAKAQTTAFTCSAHLQHQYQAACSSVQHLTHCGKAASAKAAYKYHKPLQIISL